ncbi:MAG: hypothetical protein AAGJ93_06520 [Bacteroidota bacterium]
MQQLQQIGQLLIAGKPQEALEQLRSWAKQHLPDMLINIELQLSRLNLLTNNFTKGLMDMTYYQTNLIQVNNAVLVLIDDCKKEFQLVAPTVTSEEEVVINLHEYHAYTCDRVEHSDSFRQFFAQQEKPVQFYFLYGGDLQSHEGFFRRVAYDLEGRLQDYLNPGVQTSTQALQLEMTFEFSRQLEHYKQNILRSFFAMMGLQPNDHQPLLEKDLAYLLPLSPRLHNLKPSDYICIYLHISQYDWDAELCTAAAKWFVNDFCQKGQLNTPATMLIFFAIEYDEDDEDIKAEVETAIKSAETLKTLPELGMVDQRDIGRWMERYKQISPNSRTRRELVRQTFGNTKTHYMEDVELELKKILDKYNNNLLQ